jgi:hypothetical protein
MFEWESSIYWSGRRIQASSKELNLIGKNRKDCRLKLRNLKRPEGWQEAWRSLTIIHNEFHRLEKKATISLSRGRTMSLLARFFPRVDMFLARFQLSSARVQTYRMQSFNAEKSRPVALFGADPSGFGEDYVAYKVPQPQPFGPQPLEHRENVHGFIRGVSEAPLPTERGYEDPAISPHASRTSETTDQKPISKGILTPGDVWDGIVRNEPKKKNFQTMVGKELTPADLHAIDLKTKYEFDFRV